MGVQDLYSWVKKTHPSTIRHVRSRFGDPRIKGKRIAIDATLLTNTFHFGRDHEHGKQALIGWYNMIKEMRAAGMQPVAIWDQRGTREWKAAEAQKRLAARALALARRNHEDERANRLVDLRDVLMDFQALPQEEQGKMREYWMQEKWDKHGPPAVRSSGSSKDAATVGVSDLPTTVVEEAPTSKLPSTADKESESTEPASPSSYPDSSALFSKLTNILQSYKAHDRPREHHRIEIEPETSDALQHLRDLEVFTGESAERGAVESLSEDGESEAKEAYELDSVIRELVPFEEYRETKRQNELTAMEGEIIETLLATPRHGIEEENVVGGSTQLERTTPPKHELDLDQAIDFTGQILEKATRVRQTYAKALALPSVKDHEDCRNLLLQLGVPILTAPIPYEAEGLASSLAKRGLVDFVGTEDSDVLAYEAPLLRSIAASGKTLSYFNGETIRQQSQLSPEAYLDFCILLGTDASPRIPKVGPVTAFKYIQKYGTIESMLENEPTVKERIPEGYMDMVYSARKVFKDLPPIPDDVDLSQGVWDMGKVDRWLEEEHGISFVSGDKEGTLENLVWKIEKVEVVGDDTANIWYGTDEEGQARTIDGEPNWEAIVREALEDLRLEAVEVDQKVESREPWEDVVMYDEEKEWEDPPAWESIVEAETRRR